MEAATLLPTRTLARESLIEALKLTKTSFFCPCSSRIATLPLAACLSEHDGRKAFARECFSFSHAAFAAIDNQPYHHLRGGRV